MALQNTFLQDINDISQLLSSIENKVILCDENTFRYCFPLIKSNPELTPIIIPAGEKSKTLQTLELIWEGLVEMKADRNTTLINLGGGMLTDLGGFAASVYKRGIRFINIPTTLMGMVDAAHGGKTGINFKGLKNYLGTFTKPESVLIWPGFLETLSFENIQSGFAEMLKHGLIADASYFENLTAIELNAESIKAINWRDMIQRSVEIKTGITDLDFEESGNRKLLNFGHTLGHAFESYFMDDHLTHGHYVAAGMICETWLSSARGKLSKEEMQMIIAIIDMKFDRIKLHPTQLKEIEALVKMDKKNHSGTIQCVFLEAIGVASFDNPITSEDIIDSLNFYNG